MNPLTRIVIQGLNFLRIAYQPDVEGHYHLLLDEDLQKLRDESGDPESSLITGKLKRSDGIEIPRFYRGRNNGPESR